MLVLKIIYQVSDHKLFIIEHINIASTAIKHNSIGALVPPSDKRCVDNRSVHLPVS